MKPFFILHLPINLCILAKAIISNPTFDNGTELDGPSSKTSIQSPDIPNIIIGEYEIDGYTGERNGYHYVNITKKPSDTNYTFIWMNAVGEECPYYNKGHTVAILHTNSPNGIEIEGPWNERYIKKNGTSWKLL